MNIQIPTEPPIKLPDAISYIDAVRNERPTFNFVLPNFLAGTVGGIVSPGGTGKSYLALQACMQIAGANEDMPDMLGIGQVAPGKVVYVPAEDPVDVVTARMHDIGQQLSDSQNECVHDNMLVKPLIGMLPNIMDDRWRDTLLFVANGCRLMVVDTLRRFHVADENDSAAMAEIMGRFEQVAAVTGCAIAFAHHVTKGSALVGSGDSQQASRGSSVITDHARWQAFLVGMTEQEAKTLGIDEAERKYYVRVGTSKANYGEPQPDRWLRRLAGGVLWHADWLGVNASKSSARKSRQKPKPYKPWMRQEQETGDDDW